MNAMRYRIGCSPTLAGIYPEDLSFFLRRIRWVSG